MLTNTTEIGTARLPLRRVTIPALTAVPPSATRLTIISVDEPPGEYRIARACVANDRLRHMRIGDASVSRADGFPLICERILAGLKAARTQRWQ